MKKLLLMILACMVLFSCSDEKKSENKEKENKEESLVIEKDDSNFYSGKVVILYQNGNIKYVENYQNGVKQGEYMNCYKSGTKKAYGIYKSGKRAGTWVWYDENGEINYAVNYDEMA